MKIGLKTFLLFLIAPMASHAASIAISKDIQIEPVSAFTTKELWSATTPESVEIAPVVVNHRMIDTEAAVIHGKWRLCGLVMIGNGDIGTQPVAFRIWTKSQCDLSVGASGQSESSGNVHMDFHINSALSLPIQVSKELVVTAAGMRIGRIR